MTEANKTEIFLVAPPGLEDVAREEAILAGFSDPFAAPGGVTITGTIQDAWRANLVLRGAGRVLLRLGGFPVFHLAQLDKRARKFGWGRFLRRDVPVSVDVTCKKSKIYHAGAARQRIETALTESFGVPLAADAPVQIKARIDSNYCLFSVDTSGESLHKRGFKEAVGKAPLRETLAALFLRQCGFTGKETVLDPMCGSGTFPIEAAQMAYGHFPGRNRSFAFEYLAQFDRAAWDALRSGASSRLPDHRFFGFDRDQGAIAMSNANALRADVAASCSFSCQPIGALKRPEGPPGLVIVNPPYGARIGNKKLLFGLYAALGDVLKSDFKGWRVGLITSEASLARATGLSFPNAGPPIPSGGLKIRLFQSVL